MVVKPLSFLQKQYVISGLAHLTATLLVHNIQFVRQRKVDLAGVQQMRVNCEALQNAWMCGCGILSVDADRRYFIAAMRAIEMLKLQPGTAEQLLESAAPFAVAVRYLFSRTTKVRLDAAEIVQTSPEILSPTTRTARNGSQRREDEKWPDWDGIAVDGEWL